MHVDVIDEFGEFQDVEDVWNSVYARDPEAQFFLSWTWISRYLKRLQGQWFILAARPGVDASTYAAFFPLRLRTKLSGKGGHFFNEINMAGNYVADYTGLICAPDIQDQAIPAFARYLKRLNWARLNLEYFNASQERIRLLLEHFPGKTFRTRDVERINKPDINNCICPYVDLPDDWETYLGEQLSSNTRQKLRRFLRQVESSGEFRITHADADTIERDVEILLQFWQSRWGERKGQRLGAILRSNRATLMDAFASRTLFLPVLWHGDRPLGALGSLVDRQKKALLFYVGGRDESWNAPPPGLVLHGHSIRYAIENGFETYDFLRGNEPYKYSFGARERAIRCIIVSTRTGRNLGSQLDARCLPAVLQQATELHESGRLAEAERGYRQILKVEPGNPDALYRLGQLVAGKGDHRAAARLFRALVAVRADSDKAWYRLGQALQAQRRFADAAEAFRKAAGLNPGIAAAHYGLGQVLLNLRRFREAAAALRAVLAIRSGGPKDEIIRANARYLLGKLSPSRRPRFAALNATFGDRKRESGEIDLAIISYRQAIDMEPGLARAHYGLGLALQSRGDTERARRSYRKVLELEPGNRDVHALLSEAPYPPK